MDRRRVRYDATRSSPAAKPSAGSAPSLKFKPSIMQPSRQPSRPNEPRSMVSRSNPSLPPMPSPFTQLTNVGTDDAWRTAAYRTADPSLVAVTAVTKTGDQIARSHVSAQRADGTSFDSDGTSFDSDGRSFHSDGGSFHSDGNLLDSDDEWPATGAACFYDVDDSPFWPHRNYATTGPDDDDSSQPMDTSPD